MISSRNIVHPICILLFHVQQLEHQQYLTLLQRPQRHFCSFVSSFQLDFRFFHKSVFPWPLSILLPIGAISNKLFTGVYDTGDILLSMSLMKHFQTNLLAYT
jgi:hypothetical protein